MASCRVLKWRGSNSSGTNSSPEKTCVSLLYATCAVTMQLMGRRSWMTAVGVATVAIGVFAFEWPRHSKAIESAEAYFPEDLADYDLSSAGYDKKILHQTGFATYTSREDAEDQITIRVARYRPFGNWSLTAIER